jgi:dihydrodipicolinate synthase/N-acetylneuraminate lyase
MLAGATGYTSGSGCVAPRTTLAMHRLLANRKYDEALKLLEVLRPLEDYRGKEGESFNISAIKYAISVCGYEFGPCRPPQRRLTSQEESEIRRIVEVLSDAERSR